MRRTVLPFVSQFLRGSLAHGIESLGRWWRVWEECPSAWALPRARREALLACGPQQAAAWIAAAAFEYGVGPRHARYVRAVEQAGPRTLVALGEGPTKRLVDR
jgi:hypothetical protein